MPKPSRRVLGSLLILAVLGGGAAAGGADLPAGAVSGSGATNAKTVDGSAKTPVGPQAGARAKLLKEANARLLGASRQNQCAFRKSSDVLLPGCEQKLKRLADTLLAVKKKLNRAGVADLKFEVLGHTDSSGLPDFNREISERRASNIARELVGLGVPSTEILSFGLASSQPLVTPDDTPEKQAKNQRYEIQVKF
jgi:OOP family OmpA-OmpF porin